jgi:hypothetical protein
MKTKNLEDAVKHDVGTSALRRVDKFLRIAMVPFEYDPSLLTCDDAFKAHGASHWKQVMLFLPLGPYAEVAIPTVYLHLLYFLKASLSEDIWNYLQRHSLFLPQHIHGNDNQQANHLGLALYFYHEDGEELEGTRAKELLQRLFGLDTRSHHITRLGHLTIHAAKHDQRSHMNPHWFKLKLSPAPIPWIVLFSYLPPDWSTGDLVLYLIAALGLVSVDIIWAFFYFPNINDRAIRLSSLQRRLAVVCANEYVMDRILTAAHALIQNIHECYNDPLLLPPTITHANQHGNPEKLPVYTRPPTLSAVATYVPTFPSRTDFLRWTGNKQQYVKELLIRNQAHRSIQGPLHLPSSPPVVQQRTTAQKTQEARHTSNPTSSTSAKFTLASTVHSRTSDIEKEGPLLLQDRASSPFKRNRSESSTHSMPSHSGKCDQEQILLPNEAIQFLRQSLLARQFAGEEHNPRVIYAQLLSLLREVLTTSSSLSINLSTNALLEVVAVALSPGFEASSVIVHTLPNGSSVTRRLSASVTDTPTYDTQFASLTVTDAYQTDPPASLQETTVHNYQASTLPDFQLAGGFGR